MSQKQYKDFILEMSIPQRFSSHKEAAKFMDHLHDQLNSNAMKHLIKSENDSGISKSYSKLRTALDDLADSMLHLWD